MNISLFWDNQELSKLEILTIKSYSAFFKSVNLFTYSPSLFNSYKNYLNVINANEILDERSKFYYEGVGDCPIKSVVGFSDIFRYKLLHTVGGWYSDMDCTCLNSFDSLDNKDVVLRPHADFNVVSNICKFSPSHAVMRDLFETTTKALSPRNGDWCLPLKIFKEKINEYNLNSCVVSDEVFGNDAYTNDISRLLNESFYKINLKNRLAIHWCASAIKTGNWASSHYYNTDDPKPGTLLSYLYSKYDI